MQHGRLVVELTDHRAALRPGARDEAERAMSVDVVLTGLRVVFVDEDGHLPPKATVRKPFDDAAQRKVVIGHVGVGR